MYIHAIIRIYYYRIRRNIINQIYTTIQVYLYALCIYIRNYIHICKQIHTI